MDLELAFEAGDLATGCGAHKTSWEAVMSMKAPGELWKVIAESDRARFWGTLRLGHQLCVGCFGGSSVS